MEIKKLIQIVFFILKQNNLKLNYMKLIKILYLSDREALDTCGESITENNAVSMDQGPVLVELYNYIKNNYSDDSQLLWNRYFRKEEYNLICINTDISNDEICDFEKDILINIEKKYHDVSVWNIVKLVHNPKICPEWTDPNGSSIPIRKNELLSQLGYTPEEREYLLENEAIYNFENKKISTRFEMFLNNTIQLKDSFRDVPVETSSKPKRHIMFVIAESDTEILAVPMDSVFNTITVRTKKIIANYPQSKEFELEINAFNYKRITVPSFINYKKATIIDKLKLDFLLQDYQIDLLEPISDTFLSELRKRGIKSKFLTPICKQFLLQN